MSENVKYFLFFFYNMYVKINIWFDDLNKSSRGYHLPNYKKKIFLKNLETKFPTFLKIIKSKIFHKLLKNNNILQ